MENDAEPAAIVAGLMELSIGTGLGATTLNARGLLWPPPPAGGVPAEFGGLTTNTVAAPAPEKKDCGTFTTICVVLGAVPAANDNGVAPVPHIAEAAGGGVGGVVGPKAQHTVAACVGSLLVTNFPPVNVSVTPWAGTEPTVMFVGLIEASSGVGFGAITGVTMKFRGFDKPLFPAPEKGLWVMIVALPAVATSDAGMTAETSRTSPAVSSMSVVASLVPFHVM